MRSGMCSRRFMAAIASRSSSDGANGVAIRAPASRKGRDGRKELAPRGANGRNGLRNGTGDTSPLAGVLERLTRVRPGRHRVVTCYLKLEPRDRSRGKYLIKVKNRVKSAVQALPRLGLERAAAEAVTRDLERVQQYLRTPGNLPSTQGVAIFACEGVSLFETVPLPVVYRSRLAVDASPLVRELASVEDEFGRLLTVVLDRTSARFFE